jgi:hypothetical protein
VYHEYERRVVDIVPCVLTVGTDGDEGQIPTPTALPSRKETSVPIEVEVGWDQSRAGRCEEQKSNLESS